MATSHGSLGKVGAVGHAVATAPLVVNKEVGVKWHTPLVTMPESTQWESLPLLQLLQDIFQKTSR